ncbi:MAG: hypothetical protein WC485_00300 [Opitutaceae bacterium]
MNTHEVKNALRFHFDSRAYALLWEVGNGTGMNCSRHADALVMSLWPSRGLTLAGVEIKVSRTDWLKELKDPEKAESVLRYCDHWYMVVGDRSIIRDGELPEGWGLLVPNGSGLKIKVKPERLNPKPIDRGFLAAIMRRVAEQGADAELLKKAHDDGYKLGFESSERTSSRIREQLAEKERDIIAFQKASGIKIDGWKGAENIGNAVRAVLNGEHNRELSWLRHIRETAEKIVDAVKETEGSQ